MTAVQLRDLRKCQHLVRLHGNFAALPRVEKKDLLRSGAGPTVPCNKIESPRLLVLL